MKRIINSLCLLFLFPLANVAQEVNAVYAENTFENTRVVVGHSIETLQEGDLDFLISHKFGRVNQGAYEFFGLDQAIIRLGFDYGIKQWLNVGVGRSSLNKMLDGFIKVKFLQQQTGAKNIPVSITGISTIAYNTLKNFNELEPLVWQNRLSYCHQIMVARQFNERLSIQVAPSLCHYNLVDTRQLSNDVFSVGIAGKYQLLKAMAFKFEYIYTFENQLLDSRTNSLALGFDFDTGSHVFQTHLSNSGGLIESAFIGDTTGKWLKGDVHLGFTISRVFRLKGRRY